MVRNDSYSNIAPVVLVAGGGGAAILSLLKNTFSYPTCIGSKYKKDVCNEAVYECRAVQGLKWRKGGKAKAKEGRRNPYSSRKHAQ